MKETRPFSMKGQNRLHSWRFGMLLYRTVPSHVSCYFYTLVLKVNLVHVGILMLSTKLWDAINDPLIGALVDSHQNKGKGKFIPWIKFFAFPTAVLCILGLRQRK